MYGMDRNLWAGMLIISTVVFIGVIGAVRTLENWLRWNQLQTEGEAVSGEIIATRDRMPWIPQYYVTYVYEVDGTPFTSEERVGRAAYRSYGIGRMVRVLYLPETPALAVIDGNIGQLIAFTATTLVWLLGGIVTGVVYWRAMNELAQGRARLREAASEASYQVLNMGAALPEAEGQGEGEGR
jgi:hypothetical protein